MNNYWLIFFLLIGQMLLLFLLAVRQAKKNWLIINRSRVIDDVCNHQNMKKHEKNMMRASLRYTNFCKQKWLVNFNVNEWMIWTDHPSLWMVTNIFYYKTKRKKTLNDYLEMNFVRSVTLYSKKNFSLNFFFL